ncbi:MAG: hypothetical protein IJ397_04380 [Lachnospiraceae bacterium]|nr:hypothetical protein [Lachnospiraceae bacterium]
MLNTFIKISNLSTLNIGSMLAVGSIAFIAGIIIAVIVLVILIVVLVKVLKKVTYASRQIKSVTNTVKGVSKAVYGTTNVVEGVKRQQFEHATTPRTISNMSGIYLPQIQKDFPEFHYDEMRERAKNVLTSYLYCIDQDSPSKLSEGNDELKNALNMHLQLLKDRNYDEHFERMKIHKCEISNYVKKEGLCTVTFQAAIQYYHYILEGDRIKTGRKDQMTQAKYEIQLMYVQNRDLAKESANSAMGINCPNCAAPISNLGAKHCIYCGTPIVEFNIHAWNFSAIKELK